MPRNIYDYIDNYAVEPDTFLDVPFVPSDDEVVEAMLNLAKVGPEDVLYDLGSGDGRIVITAARDRGTHGIGIEIDPVRIGDAMESAGWAGVEYLVDFIEEDIFNADVRRASVVTLYLLQSINVQLRPMLLSQLRPGARIVSHAFDMGDWKPDDWVKLGGISIYKWVVPARIAGNWEWEGPDGTPYRMTLRQTYQDVSGQMWRGDQEVQVASFQLTGRRLRIHLKDAPPGTPRKFSLVFSKNKIQRVRCA